MQTLMYKVIGSKTQYSEYCKHLERLIDRKVKSKEIKDEIELLTCLIEKWDREHNTFADLDPVEVLKFLMKEHKLKAVALAHILEVSEGLISDILNYKKGLSKETIRILSAHFKLDQEIFNRPYKLLSDANPNAYSRMSL